MLLELEAEKEKMRQELLAELRAQQAAEAKPLETAPIEEKTHVEPQAEKVVAEDEDTKVEEIPTEESDDEKSNEVENKEE